ncbi:MAG TPA: hypothetical protein VFS52_14350 [Steroidobacteraceae bacterium]|nr:hypothetical protein [Steroidobacteraceae bacterium]
MHSVDAAGKIVPGATPAGESAAVWRIPVQGLRSDPNAWAIVLIPNLLVPHDANVDVLLHFHGFGAGYRMLEPGTRDYAGVLQPGQLRDVDLYQAEQQLLSLAKAEGKLVIAILPQGSERSKFGDVPEHSDAYVQDVFTRLIDGGHLPTGAQPSHVIVCGHSGGGVSAARAAGARVAHGGRRDLLLFDAINFACDKREPQTKKDGSTVQVCVSCDSNEYRIVRAWVIERIKQDVKQHVTAENLKKRGTRFRGFTHDRVDPKRDSCSYGHWYGLLQADIDETIANLHVSPEVAAQLHENFQVKRVAGAHEDVMAHGSLAAALSGG